MSELREKFEGLAYKNKWNICKYPKSDYHNKEGEYCDDFVNGAWWAFQDRQNKIDKISDVFDSFLSECELWGFDSDQASRQLEIIQEVLK